MPQYTLDIKLAASVTVDAPNGDDALKQVREAFDCADCNGGAWKNGDPILFEASLTQRPDLALIDGEDAGPVTTLHDWADLRAKEQGSGQA